MHFFAEVKVCNTMDFIGQLNQFEIVSGNQSHGGCLRQRADVRTTANQSFTTVGAAKNLIDQKENRQTVIKPRRRQQRLQPFHFRIEIRESILNGITDLDTSEKSKQRCAQVFSIDRRTGIGETTD